MVGVAQLVEPRVVIPVVVGSSPIVHPNSPTANKKKISLGANLSLVKRQENGSNAPTKKGPLAQSGRATDS